jgi:inner membrane protein
MITAFLHNLGGWAWILLGVVLMGLELLAPGMFMIWLGLAAFLTGLIVALIAPSWQIASLTFAVLSVLAVWLGRSLMRRTSKEGADAPYLNQRGAALVGQTFILDAPIIRGEGRVKVADSSWRILGQDCEAGSEIRIMRAEGANLIVELIKNRKSQL